MKRRRIAAVGITVSLLTCSFLFVRELNSPQSVRPQQPASTTEVQGAEATSVPYETAYFSSLLPGTLRQRTSTETPDGPIVGQYFLATETERSSLQVGITIGLLNNMPLNEMPALQYRLASREYRIVKRTYAPEDWIVIEKVDGSEFGFYMTDKTRYAAVVASGIANSRTSYDEVLSTLAMNWKWR